ncbi:MAG: exo-alpha-sialidase, partial [bacterium]|nr:exo-alpha-sialidase [bacterium]
MRTNPFTAFSLCLFLLLAAAPLAADDAPPTPRELRTQMTSVYQALQTDVEYLALTKQLEGNLRNREVVDRYLSYLPISPMLMLEIDMYLNTWEIAVPRIIAEWHQRWIELHEKEAVEMYGKAYVQGRLNPVANDGGTGAPAWMTKATVGTNRNSAATSTPAPEDYQGEIQVVVNPNDADEIVSAANTWDNMGGSCGDGGLQAAFYSSDGGTTWDYSCPPDAPAYGLTCTGNTFGSDPALSWNDSDEVFLEYMLICSLGGGNYRFAIVVARSTTGGATWTPQGVVINSYTSGALEDKNFYAIDNNSASPYYGRHYTCWDRNNNEKSAWSSNNGVTWHEVDLPTTTGSGSGYRLDLGCELAVEDNGTVHVIYDTLWRVGSNPANNEEMFYSRSTNGGLSWSTPLEIRDFNLVGFSNNNCPDAQDSRCIGPMGALDVDNSGGACDGNLYATFGDYTTGGVNNTDIYVRRSTNGGTTWDTPVQVNDDGLVRAQFHPFLVVDQSSGYVIVTWHDARNDLGNDAVDYFIARSVDCGVTWETNLQVSQPSAEFNNSTISYSNLNTIDNPYRNPNQYGEYMGLDVLDGTAYVAWTDSRHYFPSFTTESQDENVGFVKVDILPDVRSKDKAWDTGLEPDPATASNNMWESEHICVRNVASPG